MQEHCETLENVTIMICTNVSKEQPCTLKALLRSPKVIIIHVLRCSYIKVSLCWIDQ